MNNKISNVKTIIKQLKNKHYEKNLKTNIMETYEFCQMCAACECCPHTLKGLLIYIYG